MSYILDALKKIEHEKSKKSSGGRISISGDLFQERKRPAAKGGVWKIVTLITAASLLTCAGTWFVLNGGSAKSATVIRLSASPPSVPVAPPVVALPAPTQVVPVVVLPSVAASATLKRTEVGDNDGGVRKRIKIQPAALKQPVQTVQAPADIKLSGIAWQDERSGRRAVINGFLLREGAVVSGAKISEIQADRVRFSSAAGMFEIKLDAILHAEVKR